ncbi:MAG: hypothetical protein ABL879_02700 [Devosia sp.]
MKKLIAATFAAAALTILGAGSALAAGDCGTPLVSDDELSANFPFGFIVNGNSSDNCDAVADDLGGKQVAIPTGTYGVFRVDSRVSSVGQNSATRLDVNYDGDIRSHTFLSANPFDPDADFSPVLVTDYFATGEVSGVPLVFEANFALDQTGTIDPALVGTLESMDIFAAWTTLGSQQDALSDVGQQQAGLITHLDATISLLTSGNLSLEGDNELSVLGAVGSSTLGVHARYNLADGFSLLGGASLVDFEMPGASTSGMIGAGAVRYIQPGGGDMRYFGEAGVNAGAMTFSFTREYDIGLGFTHEATGSGTGMLLGAYGRGGVIWTPDEANEIVFSTTLKQTLFNIDSYTEVDPNGDPNFFAADLSGNSVAYTTLKAGADWTTDLAPDVDLTLSGALGATFGNGGVSAEVFGLPDAVTGEAGSTIFAEYGARLGWTPSPQTRLDGFITGTTGTGIGSHAQVGLAYNLTF